MSWFDIITGKAFQQMLQALAEVLRSVFNW